MTLGAHDLWILAIGATIAAACALQGTFLILRKEAMMSDAISHSVLPGIAAAVLIAGRYEPLVVFVGALGAGVAVPLLVERLRRTGRVYPDAALGAVFTLFFALGVIVVTRMGNVHLDTDCALYGEIAVAPFDLVDLGIGGRVLTAPRVFWTSSAVLGVGFVFLVVFWKEMKIGSFDEGLAATMGFRPRALQRAFLASVALTTVAAFDAVGAILVVAMFIAPPAAAYLLTERLERMAGLAVGLGVAGSTLGFLGARAAGGEVSIAGSMAAAAGGIFALAWFFSPTHGLAVRAVRLARLRKRLAREDRLLTALRAEENGAPATLAASEREEARRLLRAHRLWEAYLHRMGLPPDHLHESADRMEHFLDEATREALERDLDRPEKDPHGRPIP